MSLDMQTQPEKSLSRILSELRGWLLGSLGHSKGKQHGRQCWKTGSRPGLQRCARTAVYERWRAIASVYVCWTHCLKQDLQDGGLATGTGAVMQAMTRVVREFVSVYAFRAHCLKQDLRDCLGFAGWRPCHWHRCGHASDDKSCTRVCECLCVSGSLSEAGFAGLFGICRMAALPLAQVRSCKR